MASKLTVVELRSKLAERGLSTSGLKSDLIKRLEASIAEDSKKEESKREGKRITQDSTDESNSGNVVIHRILQPIPIRDLWNKAVDDLSEQISKPKPFMNLKEVALMLLLKFNWNQKFIMERLDESKESEDELYKTLGLCMSEHKEAQCKQCLIGTANDIWTEGTMNLTECDEAARKRELWVQHPWCGCLCKKHFGIMFKDAITNPCSMEVLLKCSECRITYPPLSSVSLEDEEDYLKLVDGEYLCCVVKDKTTCPSCGIHLSFERVKGGPMRTYQCERCQSTFGQRGN